MITSGNEKDNFSAYLIIEIVMVAIFTFFATAFFIVISSSKSGAGHNSSLAPFERPIFTALICLANTLLAIGFVLFYRNQNYVVGYEFDHKNKNVKLLVRGLAKRSLRTILVQYNNMLVKEFRERKFAFNEAYEGFKIQPKDTKEKYYFVRNNFIWEKRWEERTIFVRELNAMEEITIVECKRPIKEDKKLW